MIKAIGIFVFIVLAIGRSVAAEPVDASFNYQGTLNFSGIPLDSSADMQFKLFDAATDGFQVGSTQTIIGASISKGSFSVRINFGTNPFVGDKRWLEIAVKHPSGSGEFSVITPRVELVAVPFAMYALSSPNTSGGMSIPSGVIVMWSGSIANIPAGWAICDGTNGTPDLRGRFVLATNSGEDPGATGGSSSHTHSTPDHKHTIWEPSQTLSNVQLPSHTHGIASQTINNIPLPTHTHVVAAQSVTTANSFSSINTLSTSSTGVSSSSHTHQVSIPSVTTQQNGPSSISVTIPAVTSSPPSQSGQFNIDMPSRQYINGPFAEGGGSTGSASTVPPYYKLAFIMKL